METELKCKSCGATVKSGEKFCSNCGTKIEKKEAMIEKMIESGNEKLKSSAPQHETGKKSKHKLSIAGFVLGLVGVCTTSFVCSLLGLIFGARSMGDKESKGFAVAGLVLGIVGIVLSIFSYAFRTFTNYVFYY